MFFWKWTRSGKESKKYVSLIIDFHSTQIRETNLITNFEECKDILYLIHDVEVYNAKYNKSAGLEKESFQKQVQLLGYKATSNYIEKRNRLGLVSGQMVLGRHEGTPLDYGYSNKTGETIILDTNKLKWALKINVENGKAGKGYGSEDKLKAYRSNKLFINKDYYYDLMPAHSCIVEIVNKMMMCNKNKTIKFLENELKWIHMED